jgi:hypothetical protein
VIALAHLEGPGTSCAEAQHHAFGFKLNATCTVDTSVGWTRPTSQAIPFARRSSTQTVWPSTSSDETNAALGGKLGCALAGCFPIGEHGAGMVRRPLLVALFYGSFFMYAYGVARR